MTVGDVGSELSVIREKIAAAEKELESHQGIVESPTHPEWWSNTNAMTISSIVLCFALVVMIMATYLIKAGSNSDDVLRIFATILIIGMAVFLVVAGYSDSQIAPVMGLLGTIAGYLLGKESTRRNEKSSRSDP